MEILRAEQLNENIVPIRRKTIEWKTSREIAAYLKVSRSTVHKWSNRLIDPIPHRKLSGVIQYDFSKVVEWEKRNAIICE